MIYSEREVIVLLSSFVRPLRAVVHSLLSVQQQQQQIAVVQQHPLLLFCKTQRLQLKSKEYNNTAEVCSPRFSWNKLGDV